MTPGLTKWRDAIPGRSVVTKRAASGAGFVCTCSQAGVVVAEGLGDTLESAEHDAASKLWRVALESTGEESNPRERFVKRRSRSKKR